MKNEQKRTARDDELIDKICVINLIKYSLYKYPQKYKCEIKNKVKMNLNKVLLTLNKK